MTLRMEDVFTGSPAPIESLRDGATFSACRKWRYHLWREWGDPSNRVAWIGCNPSTATEFVNDPTIRKEIGFAKRWGFGALDKVNMFAWRSTDPRGLREPADPIGPENDATILRVCSEAQRVVIAWGSHACVRRLLSARADAVRLLLAECKTPVGHLGLCKDGQPGHPLYIPYERPFQPTLWTKVAPMLAARDVAKREFAR